MGGEGFVLVRVFLGIMVSDLLVAHVEICPGVRGLVSRRNAASDGQCRLGAGGHGLRN
jgi:hypothetical protein